MTVIEPMMLAGPAGVVVEEETRMLRPTITTDNSSKAEATATISLTGTHIPFCIGFHFGLSSNWGGVGRGSRLAFNLVCKKRYS